MVIITKRLSISCAIKSDCDCDWLGVKICPNCKHGAKALDTTVIRYDENTIESDIEISELIGIFNGEPTWRRQFLSGKSLEMPEEDDELYPYIFNTYEKYVISGRILDSFNILYDDLWAPGVIELKFITEDYIAGNSALSFKTLIRFEALKYIRQAINNASSEDLACFF